MVQKNGYLANQTIKCSTEALNVHQERIIYHLYRSKRRTIGLIIDSDGLRVSAPYQLSQEKITGFLEEKSNWIIKKLKVWQSHNAQSKNQTIWRDKASFNCCGIPITVHINYTSNTSVLDLEKGSFDIGLAEKKLEILSATDIEPYFKVIAKKYLEKKLQDKAFDVGLQYRHFYLSQALTRWGSCTSKSDIRLNWRLIFLPENLINYVIAHELAHLIEMNHSVKFWHQVHRLMPTYTIHKKTLNMIKLSSLPILINN